MESVQRATWRTQVTKISKSATEFLKAISTDLPENVGLDLSVLIERMKNTHLNLKRADEAFLATLSADEVNKELDGVVEYDDRAVTIIAKLEFHLKKLQVAPLQPERERSAAVEGVKLKAIELKKFDGKHENWLPFWEQFKCSVYENSRLSVASKFNFLSEALTGRAAATIAGFAPTEKCYEEAISLLEEEFGNTEKIIEKFVQKLLHIKPVQSNDIKGLRQLYSDVNGTIRSLKALEVTSAQYEIMVKSILLKAIPANLRVQFHREEGKAANSNTSLNNSRETVIDTAKSEDQLQGLLDFLRVELEALEISQISAKAQDEERPRRERAVHGTATSLFTNTSEKQCIFCKKTNHSSMNCKSGMSLDQKKTILKREARCFRCTNKNHNSKFCKAQWLKCENCSGRHCSAMCERRNESKRETAKNERKGELEPRANSSDNNAAAALNTVDERATGIYLQTAKAILQNNNNKEKVLSRIVMDNGSQRSFVTEEIIRQLEIEATGVESLSVVAFGKDKNQLARNYKTVKLCVKSQYSHRAITINAIVVPQICDDILPVPNKRDKELRKIRYELADDINCNEKLLSGINLLIGQDNFWLFSTNESEFITERLVAVKTFFGWTVQGRGAHIEGEEFGVLLNVQNQLESFDISDFWNMEVIGITNSESANERSMIQTTVASIRAEGGRYRVKLPWLITHVNLNNNKRVALNRLKTLTSKLQKNRDALIEYDTGIRDLVRQGIAEKVDAVTTAYPTYYKPHRPIYRDDKATTKMRIVFDASSSEQGFTSLNDHLSAGENLVADLVASLIILAESDRDSHRFLWYSSPPNKPSETNTIEEYRMTRVTFGVSSSPFLLAATLQTHFELSKERYGAVCDILKSSFYVDDLILSVTSRDTAKRIYEDSITILRAAGFNLRKWTSNDGELREYFEADKHGETGEQKILGMKWCTVSDEIYVDIAGVSAYIESLKATKRNVMKAMAKVFDPLGLLGPFTVRIKLQLQTIWKEQLDWDQALSEDMLTQFCRWQEEVALLSEFSVQRCLSGGSNTTKELHIFADASPKAYGAVAYVRETSTNGIVTNLVCSRNRVSPIKSSELSLPKLELTAALMVARLKVFLISSLDFEVSSVHLWSDSTIALNWIGGGGNKVKPYVKARVSEINTLTNIYDWRHCQGKTNPADLLTRGVTAAFLIESELWKHGPPWLMEEANWQADFPHISVFNLAVPSTAENTSPSHRASPIVPIENFSRMKRLLRVTAYVFRFLKHLKGGVRAARVKRKAKVEEVEELSAFELREAEDYWIKSAQLSAYSSDIQALRSHRQIPSDSKIISLNPVLQDGILRLSGRLPAAEFCHLSSPIILPKQCRFSELLVLETHRATMHGGINMVLSEIRKRFWFVRGRHLIKTVLNRCVICKRLQGKSASESWTALPLERVKTSRPFETVGVDFAGPLYIMSQSPGEQQKVYIMLLTCAAIRAVHLELGNDLTAGSCVAALRRFMARRGVPQTIISDNAKIFKRADIELRKLEDLMKQAGVQQLAATRGIQWKFIPERAAWWGGFWERLVRTIKNCLKSAIGKKILLYDDLLTLLTEVESVINQRPLTYISSDPKDLEPLTPSHFLNNGAATLLQQDFCNDGTSIAHSWQQRSVWIKRYLKRWRDEYLGQLRSIYHNNTTASKSVSVGDVVIVSEDKKARLLWRLAVVETTYTGRDGRVRACDVRVKDGTVLKRPIQLLYPLEVSSAMAGPEDVKNISSKSS